jgi:hypothetical protein
MMRKGAVNPDFLFYLRLSGRTDLLAALPFGNAS